MKDNYSEIFSIEDVPGIEAKAMFAPDSAQVFKEDHEITPVTIDEGLQYMPWGDGNRLPYDILNLFEEDETLSACQMFNSEVIYAGGLRYEAPEGATVSENVISEVDDFFLRNDIPSYFLGTSKDIKFFEFAVTVAIFSKDFTRIVNIFRKESVNCRFAPHEDDGYIPYVLYADWRGSQLDDTTIEKIPIVDMRDPIGSLNKFAEKKIPKVAFITRIPTADSFYYPIPTYASLFRGKWYNIKKYIGAAKEAKLKNSAPIKYLIEISKGYFQSIFDTEGIVDPKKRKERIVQAKQEILQFLTGAENSGKAMFSEFGMSPDGKELHHVKITKIENTPQGGDWETDHQEAVNMMCFAMRVHSNLVGSVPGKSQSNNSGSDKRELYTIAQAVQRPYHDIIFRLHNIIIKFNGWDPVRPVVPYIQLTTLDEHKDFKEVANEE